jgi:DNA-binding NtrC family response regulator
LIVDDERVIADTLSMIFLTNGYEARAAYSAEQATEIMVGWLPDLVIVDVILPEMNGVELAVVLSQQFPNCRILLFSGQAATADLLADAATKGYTFEILAKPVHPAEMLAVARRLITAEKPKQTAVRGEPEGSSASEAMGPLVD